MFRAFLGFFQHLSRRREATAPADPPAARTRPARPRGAGKSWRLDVRPAAQRRGISLPVMRRLWMGPFW